LKLAKYIAVLVAGIGIGVVALLIMGYEKTVKIEQVRLVKPVASYVPPMLPVVEPTEDFEKANRKLDRKLDQLEDSLQSLKARVDSLNYETDTVIVDNSNTDSIQIQGESFIVERDQLLSTELVKIEYLDIEVEKDTAKVLVDSLKSSLNIQPEFQPEYLKIEIWKSPLNFTGYKLSKTKLVVYGMIKELIVNVASKDGKILVTTNLATYVFSQTSVFKNLKVI
jgi:hypothetical protein